MRQTTYLEPYRLQMPVDAGKDLSWQSSCELDPAFVAETRQMLPTELHAALSASMQQLFCKDGIDFANLHLVQYDHIADMPPQVFTARVQAGLQKGRGGQKGKKDWKAIQRNARPDANPQYRAFLACYERLVREFVLPQFLEDVLYQKIPILR